MKIFVNLGLLVFMLLFTRTAALSQEWYTDILLTSGGYTDTLIMGGDINASDQFDPGIDVLAPPPPPLGVFAFFAIDDLFGRLKTDFRFADTCAKTWNLQVYNTAGKDCEIAFNFNESVYLLNSWKIYINGLEITNSCTFTVVGDTVFVIEFYPLPTKIHYYRIATPVKSTLMQNYPNPFNSATNITFFLDTSGWIFLSVYNSKGELVTVLASGYYNAGEHTETWNTEDFSSGVYYYRYIDDQHCEVKKCVLIK